MRNWLSFFGSKSTRRIRILSLFLLVLVLGCHTTKIAKPIEQADSPRINHRIPFKYENGFIILEVLFHHAFPLRFVMDTGAEYSVLTYREISDLLGFKSERRFSIIGADLETVIEADLIREVNLKLGDMVFPKRDMLVTLEDYFRIHSFTGTPIHGILGADILSKFVVTIDYRRKEIVLSDSQSFKPSASAEEMSMGLHRNKPYIWLEGKITEAGPIIPLKLLVDTGAALSLLLLTESHPSIELPARTISGTLGIGLGGFIMGEKGRMHALKSPMHSSEHLLVNFQNIRLYPDTAILHGRHGLLGNLWLDQFKVSLHYPEGKLYLEPNSRKRKPIAVDKSGLFLLMVGENGDQVVVEEVAEGSPAARAGVKPGDVVEKLNHKHVSLYTLDGLNRKLKGREGKRIRLKIKREGKPMMVRFVLEEFL